VDKQKSVTAIRKKLKKSKSDTAFFTRLFRNKRLKKLVHAYTLKADNLNTKAKE